MHLVLHHVAQLKHVNHTYCGRLVEAVAGTAVIEVSLAVARQTGLVGPFVKVIEGGSVKNGSGEFLAQLTACPSEYGLEYLTQVHSGRHAQGVQDNVHGSTVLQERHILLAYHT